MVAWLSGWLVGLLIWLCRQLPQLYTGDSEIGALDYLEVWIFETLFLMRNIHGIQSYVSLDMYTCCSF